MGKYKLFKRIAKIIGIAAIVLSFAFNIFTVLLVRSFLYEYEGENVEIYVPKRSISHTELTELPEDLKDPYSENLWFDYFLLDRQIRQISKYMKKNNLLIAPGTYYVNVSGSDADLIKSFDFVDADTLEPFSP